MLDRDRTMVSFKVGNKFQIVRKKQILSSSMKTKVLVELHDMF